MDTSELIELSAVMKIVPYSKATLYKFMRNSNFPTPMRVAGGKKGFWKKNEIIDWLEAHLK